MSGAFTWRGSRSAKSWPGWKTVPIDENTIVVPVPDTSKCAADAMAYRLGVPSAEGLIRNRYSGRTFIEGTGTRTNKAATKYTPLREVLRRQAGAFGRRLDRSLDDDAGADLGIRRGGAGEDPRPRRLPADYVALLLRHRHVDDLASRSRSSMRRRSVAGSDHMRKYGGHELGADSLRYSPIEVDRPGIDRPADELAGCIHGQYPDGLLDDGETVSSWRR